MHRSKIATWRALKALATGLTVTFTDGENVWLDTRWLSPSSSLYRASMNWSTSQCAAGVPLIGVTDCVRSRSSRRR